MVWYGMGICRQGYKDIQGHDSGSKHLGRIVPLFIYLFGLGRVDGVRRAGAGGIVGAIAARLAGQH